MWLVPDCEIAEALNRVKGHSTPMFVFIEAPTGSIGPFETFVSVVMVNCVNFRQQINRAIDSIYKSGDIQCPKDKLRFKICDASEGDYERIDTAVGYIDYDELFS